MSAGSPPCNEVVAGTNGDCLNCGRPTRMYSRPVAVSSGLVLEHKRGRVSGVSPWKMSSASGPGEDTHPSGTTASSTEPPDSPELTWDERIDTAYQRGLETRTAPVGAVLPSSATDIALSSDVSSSPSRSRRPRKRTKRLALLAMSWEDLEAADLCECGTKLSVHPELPKAKPMSSWKSDRTKILERKVVSQPWSERLFNRAKSW